VPSGAVRVDSVSGVVGDGAAGELMSVHPDDEGRHVPGRRRRGGSLKQGAKVTLRMPDGAESPGTVRAVATVATTAEGQQEPARAAARGDDRAGRGGELDGGDVEIKAVGETARTSWRSR
jgi:hypothetical protein